MTIATAFCNVASKEEFKEISNIFVAVFNARSTTMDLLKKLIYQEVEWTSEAGTLFRGNSIVSAIIGSFTRATGSDFLVQTLQPLVAKVRADPYSLEVVLYFQNIDIDIFKKR